MEDSHVLERIRGLAIPPAWAEVWICADPAGHLQATGTDSAGRTQYLYHPSWRVRRDRAKFEAMVGFGRALPTLRKAARTDLRKRGYPRERVLGCAVCLLDVGLFRVGSEEYAEENQTYGLATMLKRHVRLNGHEVTFDYTSKGGKRRVQSVVDPGVHAVVRGLKQRQGGRELLAFRSGRTWVDVRASDINEYIKDVTGEGLSAKDFRTWNATVLAAVALARSADGESTRTGRKRVISAAVREVAEYLGNTPAVCRRSYIDPRIFDRFRGGMTIRQALRSAGSSDSLKTARRPPVERAVLDLLG